MVQRTNKLPQNGGKEKTLICKGTEQGEGGKRRVGVSLLGENAGWKSSHGKTKRGAEKAGNTW